MLRIFNWLEVYFLMMMNAFKNVDIFGLPLILISNVKTWWKRGEGADR